MLAAQLMLVLGAAAAIACIASFKHSTLMCFPHGVYALLCLSAYFLHQAHSWLAQPLTLANLIILLVVAAVLVCVQAPAWKCATPNQVDWIVVLGCRLVEGKPGRTLTCRLTTALECYKHHPEARLMVCGGKGEDEDRSEAEAMAAFLMEQGLSQDEIVLENTSRTTAENLRNFLTIAGNENHAVALVTSDFHMGRTLSLAREVGLANAFGLPSKTPWTSWYNCAFREALILGAQKLGLHPSNISIGKKRL